ncbi:MAG: DEAD/DEAH box helicase [Clostridia bacterium]
MKKTNFKDYKLSSDLLTAIELLGFISPTEVQAQVIPLVLAKRDVLVQAQTGSGKTAAFAIPLCELVDWEENKPQVLILTPTRELALQVKEDVFNIGRFKRIKVPVLYGKSPITRQIKELKQKTHIVVGTPGRVLDHLKRETLITDGIKYLVIDEADEMLNMGFRDEVEKIIKNLPQKPVTMLFSATLPEWVASLAAKYMQEPIQVEIAAENLVKDNIVQEFYFVEEKEKLALLRSVTVLENPDSCLIFCSTQRVVDLVNRELQKLHYGCEKIHGGMLQEARTSVMTNFKKGKFRYLVATDVAARGIDVDDISLVLNFDVPRGEETYVHRIGRTGRIGKSGRAITFVTERENWFPTEILEFTGVELLEKAHPTAVEVAVAQAAFNEKIQERPIAKEEKGAKLSEDIMKIHINAGKKTKMRAMDIVGTLCSIEGITAEDIGIISILDISTFVEILNAKGAMVLGELQNRNIKGRPRRVSRVEEEFDRI